MIENIRFEFHPLIKEDTLIVDHYVAGLYNLALCDGELSNKEKEYIDKLAVATNMSKERMAAVQYIDFDKNIEVLKYDFANKQIQYTFFCDLFVLALCDGNISDEEFDYIGSMAETVNLDDRVFQYITRVAQAISKGTDSAYLLTILSRHKDVSFNQFQFYFGNVNNSVVRSKVTAIRSICKQLKELRSIYEKVDYNDLDSISETFTDENLELLDSAVEKIKDMRCEVEEETDDYIAFTEDDVYSDLEEIIHEIQHLSDMLLVHVTKLSMSQMGVEGFDKHESDFDFAEDGKALVNEIDKALAYLQEFDTYEELVKKMGGE